MIAGRGQRTLTRIVDFVHMEDQIGVLCDASDALLERVWEAPRVTVRATHRTFEGSARVLRANGPAVSRWTEEALRQRAAIHGRRANRDLFLLVVRAEGAPTRTGAATTAL